MSATAIFYACQKEFPTDNGSVKSHKSSAFYDQELVKKFMEEPLVREFQERIKYSKIEMHNGILRFRNGEEVNAVYDLLIKYSSIWDEESSKEGSSFYEYAKSEKFPNAPMLYAFEVFLGFNSLRAEIENEILKLEIEENLNEENDPDRHFIISDYNRALFTPDCEIIIDKSIFLYGKEQNLIIFDLDFENLYLVKSLWKKLGETEGTVQAVKLGIASMNDVPSVHKDGEKDCCEDFGLRAKILTETGCPRNFQFSVLQGSMEVSSGDWAIPEPPCFVKSVTWDFGDGNNSTLYQPKHNYSKAGSYTVKYTVRLSNGSTCSFSQNIDVKDCIALINTPVQDPKYTGSGSKYIITASVQHCKDESAVKYTWTFSNDNDPITTDEPRVEKIFYFNEKVTIKVNVNFADGCSASNTFEYKVSNTGMCCKNFSGEKDKYIPLDGGYKITHSFATRNIWPFHRIVVKTIHFKKNKRGNWNREKASSQYVGFWGTYAKTNNNNVDCSEQIKIDHGRTVSNQKTNVYDYGMGFAFRVGKELIHSKYSTKSTSSSNTYSDNDYFKLHDKYCP